jgi:hypothetical protein
VSALWFSVVLSQFTWWRGEVGWETASKIEPISKIGSIWWWWVDNGRYPLIFSVMKWGGNGRLALPVRLGKIPA